MDTLYLDTHSGPIVVTRTGNETVARISKVRYVEIIGWLADPVYVSEDRLSTDPARFAHKREYYPFGRESGL